MSGSYRGTRLIVVHLLWLHRFVGPKNQDGTVLFAFFVCFGYRFFPFFLMGCIVVSFVENAVELNWHNEQGTEKRTGTTVRDR
jgi:hypothetical protein